MRLSVVILLGAVVGGVLAACSGGSESVPQPEASDTSTQQAAETDDDGAEPAGAAAVPDVNPADDEPEATVNTSLSPSVIFDLVSPVVVFVQTDIATGSGILIDDRHVVTNAHVVRPFNEVRVLFPSGEDIANAEVVAVDLMADIAVLDVGIRSIPRPEIATGAVDIRTGTEVFLIGYPGEVEIFPEPSISTGIVSRLRNWDRPGITFIQTDASIAGGQSGGALVSPTGQVIGLTTFSFGDGNFALAIAMTDVMMRVQALLSGSDIDGLGGRNYPVLGSATRVEFRLDNFFHQRTFLTRGAVGSSTTIEVDSANDLWISVDLTDGTNISSVDETAEGLETSSFVFQFNEPYLVTVGQLTVDSASVTLIANSPITELDDREDGVALENGAEISAHLDHPFDVDYFDIELNAGETVTVTVDTINFDPEVSVDLRTNATGTLAHDDDSGGGMFGLNAQVSYTAVVPGTYIIAVDDVEILGSGGYFITVNVEAEQAGLSLTPGRRTNVYDLSDGDCFNSLDGRPLDQSAGIYNVNVTACTGAWQFEVLANVELDALGPYPGDASFGELADLLCPSSSTHHLVPVPEGWRLGDRELTCLFSPDAFFAPEVGDCLSTGDFLVLTRDDVVSCSDVHFGELFHSFDVVGSTFPGDRFIADLAEASCLAEFTLYVGVEYDSSVWYATWVFPTRATWNAGYRQIVCYLGSENFDRVQVESAKGSKR